jgi:hypothetical protein
MWSLSLPWPIKGGLDTPFHHTPALKHSYSHSHLQQSKEALSPSTRQFIFRPLEKAKNYLEMFLNFFGPKSTQDKTQMPFNSNPYSLTTQVACWPGLLPQPTTLSPPGRHPQPACLPSPSYLGPPPSWPSLPASHWRQCPASLPPHKHAPV